MTRSDYPDLGRHLHRAPVQYFALIMGLGFLLFGVLGFIPGATVMHGMHHELRVDTGYGALLGIFPVNVLHNLVHLAFGIWGVAAFSTLWHARVFSRSVAIIYAVLAVLGLVPALWSVFGFVPLWGNDVWLHAVIAGCAAIFGWAPVHARDVDYGGHRPHHA